MPEMNFLDYYAPYFLIKIGGKTQRELSSAIISLEVDENLESASMFTLNINEGLDLKTQKFKWLDSDLLSPEKGDDVEISMGYASHSEKFDKPLIIGKITALNPSFPSAGIPTLSIQGYDHSFCLQKSVVKEKRTFDNESDYGDIAKKIATKNGLGNGDIDSTVKACEKMTQNAGESDYAFLKRLAERIGYEFFIRDKKLHFRKPRDFEEANITLKWGNELINFNPRLSTSQLVNKVTVKGHNQYKPAEPIVGIATLKDIGVKEDKVKDKAESVKTCLKKEVETSEHNLPVCSKDDAESLARSLLKKANNSLVEGSCECVGIPELRPGMNVKIEGVGERFNGKYYIKSAKHSIGDGYKVSFEVRRGL
ncbi:phage late control D family protein [Methanobacterium formicicum]|uniref:phage late control D family protein n=1 Tax=Methanobacterium formicicum TaxID=2162 RepID=UPI00241233BF|nr:contractile injection system protein, VgrG/Pvc8 family [Methanobacterium formicicum]MDG3548135.1 contractile injection system protein, VgrG/Pvc8 family [Methanobacterium formicicum]